MNATNTTYLPLPPPKTPPTNHPSSTALCPDYSLSASSANTTSPSTLCGLSSTATPTPTPSALPAYAISALIVTLILACVAFVLTFASWNYYPTSQGGEHGRLWYLLGDLCECLGLRRGTTPGDLEQGREMQNRQMEEGRVWDARVDGDAKTLCECQRRATVG